MSNAVNVEGTVEYVEADFADAHAALPQSRHVRILLPIVALLVAATVRSASLWISLILLVVFAGTSLLTYTSGRREFIRRALADFGPSGPRTATVRFDEFGVSFETALRNGANGLAGDLDPPRDRARLPRVSERRNAPRGAQACLQRSPCTRSWWLASWCFGPSSTADSRRPKRQGVAAFSSSGVVAVA